MRRTFLLVAAMALIASIAVVPGQGASKKTKFLTFKVRLIQEQTVRIPKPPTGPDGDSFSTQLRLFAIGTVLGFPENTPMGTMAFNWGPLKGTCSSSGAGCNGTTNIETITKLPGGTITAGGKNVSLSKGIIVPVTKGTGIFKGVTGTIAIAPASVAEDVFKLTLPA
ncbi:MAG TPA: hypothetical protein VGM80_08380 [Gaiellaceae bacterium]